MNFASSPAASALSASPQFIIYFFEKDEVSKGSPVWQEYRRLNDETEAVRRADALFLSQKFTRVEVRKKGLGAGGGIIDEPVKILDANPKKLSLTGLFFVGAAFCSLAAFLITLYS